jgi:ABC-type transporter Mla MlaB component
LTHVTEPSVQPPGESAKLAWQGECCIDSLTTQYEQLNKVLEESLDVAVDLSGVSRIDTAGLQLLLSFVLDMQRRGRTVVLRDAPEAVVQSARVAGIAQLLGV